MAEQSNEQEQQGVTPELAVQMFDGILKDDRLRFLNFKEMVQMQLAHQCLVKFVKEHTPEAKSPVDPKE